ncbi:uncharacterized protein LAESUDRAFT_618912, partial [Laetiporus sulphureus 93-53]
SKRPPMERSYTPGSSTIAPSSIVQFPSKRRRIASSNKGNTGEGDTWTRWPVPASDLYVPEFSLEDEVRILAEHFLQN